MKKRILSLLLSAALLFSQTGLTALAAESERYTLGSLCQHHTAHMTECGYAEGAPCEHEHMPDCYTNEPTCGIEDTELSATNSDMPHAHTQECYALSCTHQHDGECGYSEGASCAFVCADCQPTDSGKQDEVQAQCACEALCTEGLIDTDCPICGAEGADLSLCRGKQPDLTIGVSSITVTAFDELPQAVREQPVPAKTPLADLNLPKTLSATGYTVGMDTATPPDAVQDSGTVTTPAAVTIEGVAWELTADRNGEKTIYDETADTGVYIFTPILPSGYTLAEGVALPEIAVMVDAPNVVLSAGETGDFTVEGGTLNTDYSYADNTLTIKTGTALTISGTTTTNHIMVASGVTANITLSSVSIDVSALYYVSAIGMEDASINLTLQGENILKGGNFSVGLDARYGGAVTIDGLGSLTAVGNYGGNGICGGKITINSGTVTATGNLTSSAISGDITITGGSLTAIGGKGGTGIRYEITITGGIVTAIGGEGASGIGARVNITGGTVTATGGKGGAGMSGDMGASGDITITGGTVTATGSEGGAGIKGSLSTGTNGTAFIAVSSIEEQQGKDSWSGIIFEGDNGGVYGNQTLASNLEIQSDKTLKIDSGSKLIISSGVTLTSNGTLTNNGTITVDSGGALVCGAGGTIHGNGAIDGAGSKPAGWGLTVTVSPDNAYVQGASVQFTAVVTGAEGLAETVRWRARGAVLENGLYLFSNDDKRGGSISVEATSVANPQRKDIATVMWRSPEEVAAAEAAIKDGIYTVARATANTEAAVKTELAGQINALPGMVSANMTMSESNIELSRFTAATAGNAGDPDGTDGSFDFTISLTKGTDPVTTDTKSGTIIAEKTEQFSLPIDKTYYFDLSSAGVVGTVNTAMPDQALHYVPFTYAGTVNAYSLDSTSSGQTGASAAATASDRSLFIADYNVSHSKSWNNLNSASLIFGKTFDTNYKLRSLSVGSAKANSSATGGTPTANEWDSVLNKNGLTDAIKNWNGVYSWGQDTYATDSSYRALRGHSAAAYWNGTTATDYYADLGWRPALEVLNPATLNSDGLKAVALNLNGGQFNGSTSDISIVCAGASFTAPTSDGLTRPNGNTDTYFSWNTQADGNGTAYAVGDSVPKTVTTLYAQWAAPVAEQFSLPLGETYYFDLSAEKDRIGTINTAVPDATLHYVPFTYAGVVNAYSLHSRSANDTTAKNDSATADGNTTDPSHAIGYKSDRSLFVADYNVSHTISRNDLNSANLIFGKTFDTNYKLRSLSVGSAKAISSATGGTPTANEWDSVLNKNGLTDAIKNWNKIFSGGQDTVATDSSYRAMRGSSAAANWGHSDAAGSYTNIGWRPALEVLNPATLNSDGLKAVTLNLNGGQFNGSTSDISIVCAGASFTAPSGEGLTRPSGNTDTYFSWNTQADGNGTAYAVGDSVPKTVITLYARWAAPVATHAISGTIKGSDTNAGIAATLQLKNGANTVGASVTAGSNGAYTIQNVPAGTYTIDVSCDGYTNGTIGSFTVSNANITNKDLTLTKGTTFVAVTDITGVPTTATAGTPLPLTGTVAPIGATNKTIVWHVKTQGDTGSTISGNTLSTTAAGTVTVTATIANGASESTAYTKDFTITVSATSVSTYTVTVNENGGSGATGSGSYAQGATVTLTAGNKSNYSFSSWTLTGATATSTSGKSVAFIMPAGNVTAAINWNYSGGSDNDNSGSDKPMVITPTPTPDNPNPPTNGASKVDGVVDKDGNATIKVPDKAVTDAINAAKKQAGQNGISVTLNINLKQAANSLTVTISKATLDRLIAEKVKELKITSSLISFSFNLDALTEIQKSVTGEFIITAKKLEVKALSTAAQKTIGNRPVFDLAMSSGGKEITGFGKGAASIWMPYTLQKNEVAGNLQAVYVDGKDAVSPIIGSSYDQTGKAVMFTTNHFSIYGVGYKQDAPKFTDIANHWAKDDIEFAAARGLLAGTSKTTFSPNTAMTRGMFVTALGRLAGVNVNSYKSGKFTDVKADAYYAPYANWAASKGITSGTTATTFAPDQAVTRQEMAAFMANYAKTMSYTLPKTRTAVTFADNSSIGGWASDAVKAMQMAGVINGKDGNRFDPTGTATRAEVSAVLHRYVELVIDPTTAQGLDTADSGKIVYYENGKLFTGTKTIDGTTYHFGSDGICVKIDAVVPETKKYIMHKIAYGDTLWDLSRKYKCTVAEIVGLNSIKDPNAIPVGTELKIPQK